MVIGFGEIEYSVVETTGQVVLNVVVLSGQLSQDVVVRLNTIEDSARCELQPHLSSLSSLLFSLFLCSLQ